MRLGWNDRYTTLESEQPSGTDPGEWYRRFQDLIHDLLHCEMSQGLRTKLEDLAVLGVRMADRYQHEIKDLEEEIARQRAELDLDRQVKLQIRESMDEFITLQGLSEAISSALSPEQIFDSLVALTKRVVDLEDCGLFLFEGGPGRRPMISTHQCSHLGEVVQFQLEEGIIDWVIGERKPIIIPDIETLSGDPRLPSRRSFIIVPLIVRNRGLGVFVISTRKDGQEFTSQHLELLSLLASRAALAIDNSRIYNELVVANEELKESQAQLIQSAKMAAMGELAGGIAHEINNPLQVILSRVQLLLKRERSWLEVARSLKIMEEEIHRIAHVVQGLLDFAREDPDRGGFRLLNLNEVIYGTLQLIGYQAELANIKVMLDLEGNLPHVYGNGDQLHQVFLNLIINSKQAMPQGGKLRITTRSDEDQVIVEISDTGIGIPEENLRKIFDPFFTTRKVGEGTGLGLSVTYGIIHKHKGSIEVKSEVGKGTTFVLKLPTRRTIGYG